MPRLKPLDKDEMSPEQQRLHDEIASKRSGVGGPFAIWLRLPDVADGANRLGTALRHKGKLERRLFELMVLVAARHASAQYPWEVHARQGIKAGLSPELVEDIRQRRTPSFAREDERLVYDIVTELVTTKTLSPASYERALAGFGLDLLIEFITSIGFYTMVTMVVNAFDVATKDDTRPLG